METQLYRTMSEKVDKKINDKKRIKNKGTLFYDLKGTLLL